MNLWQGYLTFPGLVFLIHVYGLPTDEFSQTSNMSCTVQNIPNGYFKYINETRLNKGRMVPNTWLIIPICNTGYIKDSDQYIGCKDGHWDKEVHCTGKPCPTLSSPSNGRYNATTGIYSDVVTLICTNGYVLQGQGQRTCAVYGWTYLSGNCQVRSCPSLSSTPSNGRYDGTSGVYGDVIRLTCNPGYDLQGQGQITCGAGGRWYSSLGNCQAKPCPSRWTPPSNGKYNTLSGFYKDVITLTCNTGYFLHGPRQRTCGANGAWSPSGRCQVKSCPSLSSTTTNGKYSATSGVYGDVITLTCNHGYDLHGQGQIACGAGGRWSSSFGRCQCTVNAKPCPSLSSSPYNGRYSATSGVYGDVITLTCNHGYDLQGQGQSTCGADGTWNSSLGSCQAKPCPSLSSSPSNGTYNATSGVYRDVVTLICNHGYDLDGPGKQTCGADGKWSLSGSCQAKPCPSRWTHPSTGKYNTLSGFYGDVITLTCNTGYYLLGPRQRTCGANGAWSPSGSCQVRSCPSLSSTPSNGRYNGTSGVYGDVITLTCDHGYGLDGPGQRTCGADRKWSPSGSCQVKLCGVLINPLHGHYNQTSGWYQEQNALICDKGYQTKAPVTRTCQADGTWSLPGGTCQAQSCGSPGTTEHGSYSSTTGVYQDIIMLLCDTGYHIQTPINRTCQANGTWSPVTEKCQPNPSFSLGKDSETYPWPVLLVGVGIGVALSLVSALIIFASVTYTRRRKKKSTANELYTIPTATREETQQYDELGRPDSYSGGNSMEEANQYEITDP